LAGGARESCDIVKPDTIFTSGTASSLRGNRRTARPRIGRLRVQVEIRRLVIRMVTDNPSWDYTGFRARSRTSGTRPPRSTIARDPEGQRIPRVVNCWLSWAAPTFGEQLFVHVFEVDPHRVSSRFRTLVRRAPDLALGATPALLRGNDEYKSSLYVTVATTNESRRAGFLIATILSGRLGVGPRCGVLQLRHANT
jgi:hypothetical protein